MVRIPGVETILYCKSAVGDTHKISHDMLLTQYKLQQVWNIAAIAIIPYCLECKCPIDWHSPPEDDVLFTCPNCSREWVKGKGWPNAK